MSDNKEHTKSDKIPLPNHKKLDTKTVFRAVRTLKKYFETQIDDGSYEMDDYINLQISIRENIKFLDVKKYAIPIPHPIIPYDDSNICLITKNAKATRKYLKDKDITNIRKVVDISQLKTKYKDPEDRTKLISSFDIFLCDIKLMPLIPGILRKQLVRHKKYPIPVKTRNLAKEIEKSLNSTTLLLNTSGNCINVKIGRVSFSTLQNCENIFKAIDNIIRKLPGQWKNVNSLSLLTSTSVSLPIYSNKS